MKIHKETIAKVMVSFIYQYDDRYKRKPFIKDAAAFLPHLTKHHFMKKILIAAMFVAGGFAASAQNTGEVTGAGQGTGTTSGKQSTTKTTKGARPKVATKHGAKDHTPGSPVGTGGGR